MPWLGVILHVFLGSTFAGVGIIAILVTGYDGAWHFIGIIAGGYILAVPMSVLIAKSLDK